MAGQSERFHDQTKNAEALISEESREAFPTKPRLVGVQKRPGTPVDSRHTVSPAVRDIAGCSRHDNVRSCHRRDVISGWKCNRHMTTERQTLQSNPVRLML